MLAERIEAVEHELGALLGLTLTQFCQVVLLPQGAFARFLHAGTDERERLLAQLFETDRYAAAQEWLGDARRETEVEVYRGLDSVGDVASRIAQVTGEEPPEAVARDAGGAARVVRGTAGARRSAAGLPPRAAVPPRWPAAIAPRSVTRAATLLAAAAPPARRGDGRARPPRGGGSSAVRTCWPGSSARAAPRRRRRWPPRW